MPVLAPVADGVVRAARWLRCRTLRRGAGALLLAVGAAVAQAQDGVPLTPVRASEHVWYVQGASGPASRANRGFNSNAAFVVTADGVVVFDALGTPPLGAALKRAIAAVTPQPIRLVVVSHWHADHFYGLQALAGGEVEIWAGAAGKATLSDPFTQQRLEQRQRDLAPDVDARTRLVGPTRWLDFGAGDIAFARGGVRFRLIDVGGAHSPEDLMLWVDNDRVLLAGDLYFSGRVPFVGTADTRVWLAALDRIAPLAPTVVIPGHGSASRDPAPDIALTRDYLLFLRRTMGQAARDLVPFEEAYAATDWSRYAQVPAFDAANRINAYNVYLRMEQDALAAPAR
jgi:glyoxylase-like metal-dependent hydrolase (beta-lactamase superfamily II)